MAPTDGSAPVKNGRPVWLGMVLTVVVSLGGVAYSSGQQSQSIATNTRDIQDVKEQAKSVVPRVELESKFQNLKESIARVEGDIEAIKRDLRESNRTILRKLDDLQRYNNRQEQ